MIAPLTENYTCTAGLAYSSRSDIPYPTPSLFLLVTSLYVFPTI